MAIKKTFQDRDGNSGSYVNLEIQLRSKEVAVAKLNFWKDQATRYTENALPYNDQLNGGRTQRIVGFDTLYEFPIDLASPLNLWEQAYVYLKTLPEFTDGIDDITEKQTVLIGEREKVKADWAAAVAIAVDTPIEGKPIDGKLTPVIDGKPVIVEP